MRAGCGACSRFTFVQNRVVKTGGGVLRKRQFPGRTSEVQTDFGSPIQTAIVQYSQFTVDYGQLRRRQARGVPRRYRCPRHHRQESKQLRDASQWRTGDGGARVVTLGTLLREGSGSAQDMDCPVSSQQTPSPVPSPRKRMRRCTWPRCNLMIVSCRRCFGSRPFLCGRGSSM